MRDMPDDKTEITDISLPPVIQRRNHKKTLIIDDELIFRKIIADALSPCGYQCVYAENPAEGIIHLKRTPFDLVLLDIMMDPIDGWDTLSHIRALPNGTEIPVVMSCHRLRNPL